MKISGTQFIDLTPEEAYRRMQDPKVLAACIPGCESLEETGPDEYRMKMKMALASLSGAFEGRVRIVDRNPPTGFKLIVEGTGKLGFMKGEGTLSFAPSLAGANVSYDGDAQVGGTLAAVGQRLIDSTAKMLIKKFFEKIASIPPSS